jgi:hypothetical protein
MILIAGILPGCDVLFVRFPVVSLRSTTGYPLRTLRVPRRPSSSCDDGESTAGCKAPSHFYSIEQRDEPKNI